MGDMKTPDFDDLLAAFDIPDATGLDAKEAIQESHDDAEGQTKSTGMCLEDISAQGTVLTSDIPAVSVIVKNTSRQESCECSNEREGIHLGPLLQNGFRGSGAILDSHHMVHSAFGKFESSFLNGDRSGDFAGMGMTQKADGLPSFSQFSPISSPEPEDVPEDGIMSCPKQEETPCFPSTSAFVPGDCPGQDGQRNSHGFSMLDKCHKTISGIQTVNSNETNKEFSGAEKVYSEGNYVDSSEEHIKQGSLFSSPMLPVDNVHNNSLGEPQNYFLSQSTMDLSHHCVKSSNSKLSSCLAALVALNAKKVSEDSKEVLDSRDVLAAVKESVKVSPKVPKSPKSPRSPLEVVKRFIKPPDSPMSICSDSSGKASPSVTTGSPPAIPRVRIKTIKTSSGQIKRTVTSVLPDSELEELQSPTGSSPSLSAVAEESPSRLSSVRFSHHGISDVVFENGKSKTFEKSAKPGCVSPKVSAASSQGGPKRKNKAHPVASLQKASSGSLRTAKAVQQQQKGASPRAVNATSAGFLPKAMHLANLNLVPHSVAASVTARSTNPRQSQLPNSVVCSTVPLVHQVKSPSPALCSPAACGAFGTLNRLLNAANPIPTYVPNLNPPPDSQISLPAHGHRCLECNDSFSLERSLAQHYSRRSVHIEVACTHCAKTLVFFNRCSLLAHARQHKSQGVVMQCTQLFMKPIAADQMFAQSVATPSVPVGSQVSAAPAPASKNSAAKNPAAKNPAAMPLYPDKVIPHGLKCLECNKQMSDYRALASHYQRLSEEMERLSCKVCMMTLPNKCSFKAHQRIHAHKSPYCCPECGAVSRSVDIQKHVKENCLHYARKIGYKCSHCDASHLSFHVLKSHIEEKHCEVFYKCSVCPVAFKTSDGCLTHSSSKHSDSKGSPQVIYKCSCEMVFKKKQLLFQHFQQSTKKLTTCIFKCPECTAVFVQKQLLMHHFKAVHRGVVRTAIDESTRPTQEVSVQSADSQSETNRYLKRSASASRKEPVVQKPGRTLSLKNAGWTCGECLHWLPDRETYVSHMKTSHGRSVKRYPCRQCERSFNSTASLRRHIRNDHGGKRRTFTCWYCTDKMMTFTKHFMLKNHISLMHGIKNPDFSQMLKAAPPEASKTLAKDPVAKRTAQEALSSHAVEAPPTKKLAPQFRCAKCGFTTNDSGCFQQHIPQHRADDSTPQCSHCGLCFTSPLALSRHLLIVHKIKELEEDKEEEDEEDEQEEGELTPESSEKDTTFLNRHDSSTVVEEAKRLYSDTGSEASECEAAHGFDAQSQRSLSAEDGL